MTCRDACAVPFTVDADLDPGGEAAPWLRRSGADVTIRRGAVPERLPDAESEGVAWQCAGGSVLIKPPCGLRLLVEGGERVRYAAGDGVADVRPFLLGSSVWSTLALQRGLLPFHASAVAHGRDVHAFTGPSAAGKSTLAAALAARGHPFFADDVLILDPASFDTEARCHGGKGLKLWPEALALAGAAGLGPVREAAGFDKVYAEPGRRSSRTAGRLVTLHVLRTGRGAFLEADPCFVERLRGRRAMLALERAVHFRRLAAAVAGRRRLYRWLAGASRHVEVFEFHRPKQRERFEEGVAHLAGSLPAPEAAAP